jgi:hypothetical protein
MLESPIWYYFQTEVPRDAGNFRLSLAGDSEALLLTADHM